MQNAIRETLLCVLVFFLTACVTTVRRAPDGPDLKGDFDAAAARYNATADDFACGDDNEGTSTGNAFDCDRDRCLEEATRKALEAEGNPCEGYTCEPSTIECTAFPGPRIETNAVEVKRKLCPKGVGYRCTAIVVYRCGCIV